MEIPKIKVFDPKEYTIKQSKYKMAAKLPTRSILLAPSGAGKTILLQNFILDIYKNCFDAIYIWSPSINHDDSWLPVKKYIDKDINKIGDQTYFDEYNHDDLQNVIETQQQITRYMKQQKSKKLFQILIVIDDFADNPEFSRSSKLLHSLFTRGRHAMISSIVSVQKFAALHPIIRVNCLSYYIFKLRNWQDLEMVLNELGALLKDKKTLFEVYSLATEEPHAFLYVNLGAKNLNEMFMINFEKRITIK